MSENRMLLDEIRELKRRLHALETRQEHPGFAASDVARKSLTLAQFSATTSAQLAGVISDETGYSAGAKVVFSIAPVFGTSISTPAIVTVSGPLTVTPVAGSGVAIVLSTTGDFSVNINQLYIDTSTGYVGFGTTLPTTKVFVAGAHVSGIGLVQISGVIAGTDAWVTLDSALNKDCGFFFKDNSITKWYFYNSGANADTFKLDSGATNVLSVLTSGNFGMGTPAPTNILSFGGNTARIVWMERHTTANTAGNSLTIQAGGATSGATDKAGGDLLLKPGDSTGSAESGVQIFGVVAGASGTADRTQTVAIRVLGNKLGFYNVTPVVRPSAYTQTYNTASKTVPALTIATLTDSTGGTADTTLAAVEATYTQATIRNNFADLASMVNKNTADLTALYKSVTQIIDDLQSLGLVE